MKFVKREICRANAGSSGTAIFAISDDGKVSRWVCDTTNKVADALIDALNTLIDVSSTWDEWDTLAEASDQANFALFNLAAALTVN